MISRLIPWILLAAALLPGAWFAWQNRAMAHMGAYHDDALYWTAGKSLASGSYRILSLPDQPPQTKYPPLLPAMLALVWLVSPSFPGNLPLAVLLQWILLPVYLWLCWRMFLRWGWPAWAAALLVLLVAAGPYTSIFGVSTLTEVPFSILLLIAFALLEDPSESRRKPFLAGLCAAAAFLTRTNAIAIVISVPCILALERRWREIPRFLALPTLAAAGWFGWVATHTSPAPTDIVAYYTSYAGFYARTFSLSELPNRAWMNLSSVFESLSRLVVFSVAQDVWYRMFAWLLAVMGIAGGIRLIGLGRRHFPAFAVVFALELVVWQYPPDPRFLFPLLPCFAACLTTKLTEVGTAVAMGTRHKDASQRITAWILAALIAAVPVAAAWTNLQALTTMVPYFFASQRAILAERTPAYQWIAANTGPGDRFVAYDDVLLYLYTGRRGYSYAVLPGMVYHEPGFAVRDRFRKLPAEWRGQGVRYLLSIASDFGRDFQDEGREALEELLRDRAHFRLVYSAGAARVFEIVP